MSSRSFGSLFMVASCAGAALGCYLVSLRVASERAALETVETRIVLAQRDLRVLQTEIGTRGRLSQLERWNAGAFALSAPGASQFLEGGFQLASLTQPQHRVDLQAPVVLASAPAPAPKPPALEAPVADDSGRAAQSPTAPQNQFLHQASLKTGPREVPGGPAAILPPAAGPKSAVKPVTAAKPAHPKAADRPDLAAAKPSMVKLASASPAQRPGSAAKKVVDKPAPVASRPVTKPARIAKTDPLAPLADRHPVKPKGSPTGR